MLHVRRELGKQVDCGGQGMATLIKGLYINLRKVFYNDNGFSSLKELVENVNTTRLLELVDS